MNAFRSHLADNVKSELNTEPLRYVVNCNHLSVLQHVLTQTLSQNIRQPTTANLQSTEEKGKALWDSIYEPYSAKLLSKLADSHPDLPVHILSANYGPLFSDPLHKFPPGHFKIGRVLTSLLAISCLRAQQGTGPQLTSHVFGLKKSVSPGSGADQEASVSGVEWLVSDQGVEWALKSVDSIAEMVVGPARTSFAGPPLHVKAKL